MADIFQVKVIKAKKLRIEPVRNEILRELQGEARDVENDLAKTTASWSKAPKFESIFDIDRAGNISILSGPVGDGAQIWKWLDEGTEPHPIQSKQPDVYPLKFVWGGPGSYQAKTQPKVIGSRAGGPRGDVVRFVRVKHPGTEARKWSETIQKQRKRRFTRRMIKATQRGLRKAKK